MRKILLFLVALCGLAFASNVNAQIQGNKVSTDWGLYAPFASPTVINGSEYYVTQLDFNSNKANGSKLSQNVKGVTGRSMTAEYDGTKNYPISSISGAFGEISGVIKAIRYQTISDFMAFLVTDSTNESAKRGNLILDVPGAPTIKHTNSDTLVADQAIALWPGDAPISCFDVYFAPKNNTTNLCSDVDLDLITMDEGNSGGQVALKMIVDLNSGNSSEYRLGLSSAVTGGDTYVVDNIYATETGKVGEASRKSISVCKAVNEANPGINLTPGMLRSSGKFLIYFLYKKAGDSSIANFAHFDSTSQKLIYDPIIGIDNIYCTSGIVNWYTPAVTVSGTDLTLDVNVLSNKTDYAVKFKLKDANRLGDLKILFDPSDNYGLPAGATFKPAGCVKANDGNGNYTVDVEYTTNRIEKNGYVAECGQINVAPNADGTVTSDDLEITVYLTTGADGKARTIPLEIDNGLRFFYKVKCTSSDNAIVSTVADLKAALSNSNYAVGEDITILLKDCTDDSTGIYQLGKDPYVFPQTGGNLTIKAAEGSSPKMWGSFISSNGMKVKTITFDGLSWNGGDSTLTGYNLEAYQPFTLSANDSIMENFMVTNCTFLNLDYQRIFRANNPAKAVCRMLTFEKNYFDNMGWNRKAGTHGNTFIQLGNGATYECDNFVFKNNILKNFHGNQLFTLAKKGTTAAEPVYSVTIENNTFYKLGGQGTSMRNFLEYNQNLAGKNSVVNINNNLIYDRWSYEKFPQSKVALFTPAEGQSLVVNLNNNFFFPDTVCTNIGGTENLYVDGTPTSVTRNDLTMSVLGVTEVFISTDDLTIDKSSKLYTAGTNGTFIGAEQCYVTSKPRIAYITKKKTMSGEGSAQVADDPVYQMLKADANLNVVLDTLTDVSATAVFDLNQYDVIIIQESMGGGDKILTPAGALGLAKINKPFIYNKAYAFKKDRALSNAGSATGAETEGTFYLSVEAANQTNDLFKGFTFTSDKVKLLRSGADDNGGNTLKKGLNYANNVEISAKSTLLGLPANITATPTISFNDIPAGTTIGGETLAARMITLGMNFGAICKNGGTNLTDAGLTLWRNAVYSLAGLEVPAQLLDAPGDDPALASDATLSELKLSAGELSPAFSADVTAYSVNLPTGTTTVVVTATAADKNAVVAGTGSKTFDKEGTSAQVEVTAEDGSKKTYTITITVGVNVGEFALAGIRMYPNPAGNFLAVDGLSDGSLVKVVNAAGQQLIEKTAAGKNLRLDLSGFNKGIYMLRVETNGKVSTAKFIKE